jgi:CpeT/CpcT family (DUF1001)
MLILVLAFAIAFTAPAQAEDLNAQVREIMAMLPGEYDNAAQMQRQGGGQPFYPVRTIIKPVKAPIFGENVLYLEEYRDNDPTKLTRIRLYTFSADAGENAVRLHLVNPLKPEALQGAHADLAKVEALTAADVRKDRNLCDVLIRKQGIEFRGAMKERTCDRPDKTWVDYTLIISQGKHWVRNRARSLETNAVAWEFVPGAGEGFIEQSKLP